MAQEKLKNKSLKELKLFCPYCNGQIIYYRLRSNTYFCRRCGNDWKKGKQENKTFKDKILNLLCAVPIPPENLTEGLCKKYKKP